MTKRSPTTKDIGLLHQLFLSKQLTLAPEFQRNAVWPSPAKAYLIDTVVNDRPIPLLFFQRTTSAQSGRSAYIVIDGQQRLRAIFDFLDDKFRLTQSAKKSSYFNKRFSDLSPDLKDRIRNYDLIIEELSGYSDNDIRDMFIRMNRYVLKLSPQEMRHAKATGHFHKFVEKLGENSFWKTQKIFSQNSIQRMRAAEFTAEAAILLIEGPQDKKTSIDVYYAQYRSTGLRILANIWRPVELNREFEIDKLRELNLSTLNALEPQGILRSVADDVYRTIVQSWPFPLYALDLSVLEVDRNELRNIQRRHLQS
jgi:Protein of unknown function DUF262